MGSVRRARLVDKAIGRERITLVCAPAGSGKTMAVADWASHVGGTGSAVAWLTVEDRDDRPFEFWSAVIEAFIAVAPPEAAARLDSLSPPRQGLEIGFVAALAGALAAGTAPPWLVLDDMHRLTDPDVLEGIDLLVSVVDDLRAVFVCRHEPAIAFHRWRLTGALGEVRTPELAFTDTEAEEMLAPVDLRLDAEDVARLVARTEGWAAGLRLAAVSLEASEDPVQFLSTFEGDQRAVADYLFGEIVQYLEPELRDFLVATCTPEQLSVELAAHLSGRPDAGEVLDRLCRANALVVQSGDSTWYRYHSLLRGYLRGALARRDVDAPSAQHARTARWFAQHDEPAIALDHAVRSGDDDLLRELVHRHGLRLVLSGQAAMVRDTIGAPSDAFAGDQRVAIVAALAALDATDLPAADEWLPIVRALGPASDALYAALAASAVVQRSLLGGDVRSALARSGILELRPTEDADVDLMVLAYRAAGRMRTGDYRGAVGDLERALVVARSRGYDQSVLWLLSQLAGMSAALCDFSASLTWSSRAIEFAERRGWADSPRLSYAYLVAAWTDFQTGGPAHSVYAEQGVDSLDGVNNVEVETAVRCMHAIATGDAEGGARRDAAETLHRILQGPAVDEVSPALNSLATQQSVRLALAVGRPEWALDAAVRLERQLPGSAEPATVRATLLAARGRARDALEVLAPVQSGQLPAHVPTTLVLAHLLAATLHTSLSNPSRAFEALEVALAWAAPNRFSRPFLDAWPDVEPLLTANRGRFGAAEDFVRDLFVGQRPEPARLAGLLNLSLTAREFDVLRDLPSIMTVAEIAVARGLSENTVKTHVRAIYQKLGVSSRGAAVREARSRGLL